MPTRSAVRQAALTNRRATAAVAAARGKAVAAPHSTQVLRSRLGNDMAQAVVERLRSAAVQRPAANAAAAPVNGPTPVTSVTPAAAAPERAPAAPSPEEAVASVVAAVHQRATTASRHGPPAAAVASAQAAAVQPLTEQTRAAAAQTVGAMDAVQLEALRRGAFKGQLRQAIRDATPQRKTPSEAEDVMEGGGKQTSAVLRGQLTEQRSAAAGPMASAAAAESPVSAQAAPPATALRVEPIGVRPGAVSAAPVVPAPLSPQQFDSRTDRGPADAAWAQTGVSPDRLSAASDPVFAPAADARGAAERHEASAQARYRAGEAKEHAAARAGAELAIARGLDGLHEARLGKLTQVGGRQRGVVDKDAERRRQIAAEITAIKDSTKNDVALILAALESESVRQFEDGLTAAEAEYEAAFEDAKGGLGTWLTTWGEDWEAHIAQALAVARERYLARVDVAIETVADVVDAKVREAKRRVALGRKTVDDRIAGLDAHLREVGLQARDAVAGDFDAMNAQIDERRDGLVAQLTQRYKDSYERMSAREQELRDANKTLWQRALDATVGVVKQILAFKAMLTALLGRAAGVVEDIVADPIGFLGNLVAGVMAGLKGFVANLASHLKKGLMDWLFGALAGAGLTMPETFDLKGVVSLVLQFLGLTYANFRARAVSLIGEPVVQALEQAAEVFKVLVTEGGGGLWRFIKEKVAELKSMVLDGIMDFIREKVIVAGVTWIIGLLNPASAFFKACKAIYDIGVFFVQRGQQIATLVSAVAASMAAIAKGNLSAAAAFVENALARSVPMAIGFLAGLLGLGDPSKPVQVLMKKAQAPVNKAIDWVIHGAVKLVKAAGSAVKGLLGRKDSKDETPESALVRERVRTLLTQRLGHEASVSEAQRTIRQVATELSGEGVKRIELGPEDKVGRREILVEASPLERVAALIARRVQVAVEVTITMKEGAPALVGILKAPMETSAGKFYETMNFLRHAGAGGTDRAATLPAVSMPSKTPAKKGAQPSGGVILEPEPDSSELKIVTWNTGVALGGKTAEGEYLSNVSHAEHQFVEWFWDRPYEWKNRVASIQIKVQSSSAKVTKICERCAADLNGVEKLRSGMKVKRIFIAAGQKDPDDEKMELSK